MIEKNKIIALTDNNHKFLKFIKRNIYLVEVELLDLLLETRRKTRVHTATTRKNDVGVELGTGINIGLVDTVEQLLSHTKSLNIHQVGLEESLRGLESLSSDLDDTSVGELL